MNILMIFYIFTKIIQNKSGRNKSIVFDYTLIIIKVNLVFMFFSLVCKILFLPLKIAKILQLNSKHYEHPYIQILWTINRI